MLNTHPCWFQTNIYTINSLFWKLHSNGQHKNRTKYRVWESYKINSSFPKPSSCKLLIRLLTDKPWLHFNIFTVSCAQNEILCEILKNVSLSVLTAMMKIINSRALEGNNDMTWTEPPFLPLLMHSLVYTVSFKGAMCKMIVDSHSQVDALD